MSEQIVKSLVDSRTKTGLKILEAALLLGILGDTLLRATPWGLNVFLWIGALVAAMLMLTLRRRSEFLNAHTIALHVAIVFFAAMFVWRDSLELKILNTLAVLTILSLLTLPALKIKTQIAGIVHYFYATIWSGLNAVFAPFYLLFGDIKWKTIPQAGWTKHLIAVLRGLAIAAPILLVFGALFMAADAVFEGIIEQTFHIDPAILFTHIFLTGFFSWIVAGYLRGSLFETFAHEKSPDLKAQTLSITEQNEDEKELTEATSPKQTKSWDWRNFDNSVMPKSLTLGAIEVSIVLGLINLLFLGLSLCRFRISLAEWNLSRRLPTLN